MLRSLAGTGLGLLGANPQCAGCSPPPWIKHSCRTKRQNLGYRRGKTQTGDRRNGPNHSRPHPNKTLLILRYGVYCTDVVLQTAGFIGKQVPKRGGHGCRIATQRQARQQTKHRHSSSSDNKDCSLYNFRPSPLPPHRRAALLEYRRA